MSDLEDSVLLVEDNEHNRYLIRFLLERGGYGVREAADGPAAMHSARERPPAVILLDIQLPGMDGYQVAHALRELPALAGVPIVAVTSYAMPGDREKALAAGCTGYIEKPIDPATFVTEMETLAGLHARAPREPRP